jgi:GNAT superfamily N-acetyltransferase
MTYQPLDNPIWAALETDNAHFASGDARAKRYPRDVAPFAGISGSGAPVRESLASLLQPNDPIYLIGPLPASDRWLVEMEAAVLQMTCPSPRALVPSPMEYRELHESDVAAMLELTSLVFPGYFRERTFLMGRYLGIFADGVLVAMAGERMGLRGYREISAVCTRTGFTGRGYAGRLISVLARSLMVRGIVPFLHLSPENTRARSLYRSLGFVERCELPLTRIRLP